MIEKYLKVRTSTKLIALLALTGLSAVIAWTYNLSILSFTGWTLVFLLAVHFSLTYTSGLLTSVVILVEAFIFVGLAYGIEDSFTALEPVLQVDVPLLQLLTISVGAFVLSSYGIVAYMFARGRMWFNLFVAFLIFNVVSTPIWVFNTNFLLLGIGAGWVAGLAYLGMRSYVRSKNRLPLLKYNLPSFLKKKGQKLFTENKLSFKQVTNSDAWSATHFVVWSQNQLYNIHMLNAKESFHITPHGVQVDGVNNTRILEELRLDVKANKKTIPADRAVSVVVLPNDRLLPEGIVTLNISKWKQPDHSLGLVVVVTPARFNKLIQRQVKASKISQKAFRDEIFG